MYKTILEHKYDKKVVGLYLVRLHPNDKNYERVKVPFLDIEINNLKDFTNLISELKVRSLNFKIIRNRKTNQLYVN